MLQVHDSIDLVILGSGPAGYTAAIYGSRAGLETVLYQGKQPGGQLTTTTDVENYPGYPQGILGPKMMADLEIQASRFGTIVEPGTATAVDLASYPYEITIDDKDTVSTKAIIIATGASAKSLGLPSEERLYGKGVSTCAVCDGFFFKGQQVAVVGGGDSAAEEALYLSRLCETVHMLVRRDQMRASHIMQQRVKDQANITIMWHTEVVEILGKNEVTGLRIINNQTRAKSVLEVEGVFIAIGHTPNTQLFADYLERDEAGYIKTLPGSTKTNLPGVFAAGDVQDAIYRQAITASGTGCMAAMDAERFVSAQLTGSA